MIVLNIGLQARILNNEVFAIFVVMALVTTFVTTPLVLWFYPESYRKMKADQARGMAGEPVEGATDDLDKSDPAAAKDGFKKRFVVVLERLESLPSMMAFVRVLGPSTFTSSPLTAHASDKTPSSSSSSDGRKSADGSELPANKLEKTITDSTAAPAAPKPSVSVDAFRLLALDDRTSALLRASESEVTKKSDSILHVFSAFANLASVSHSTSMSIVPQEEYADTVTAHVEHKAADMLVIPWTAGTSLNPEDDGPSALGGGLESVFGMKQQAIERSPQYAAFVRNVFVQSSSDVGLFLDAGMHALPTSMGSSAIGGHQHIYLPFHGGPDDRTALDFVMQLLSNNPNMKATIVRFVKSASGTSDLEKVSSPEAGASSSPVPAANHLTIGAGLGGQDTIYPGASRLAADTADNLALARYFPSAMLASTSEETAPQPLLPAAAARAIFITVSGITPMQATLAELRKLSGSGGVLVVAGRSRHSAPSHRVELEQFLKEKVASGSSGVHSLGIAASSEVRKTLGDIGSALVVSGEASSILIIQSAVKGEAYLR